MKKLVMMLVCMFAVHTMVMADNDKPIEMSQLPAKAQTFIKTYFKDRKVAMAKLESGMFYKSYDVVFTNGEKVEFDKSGEWKEVRCRQSEVPAQIVPEAIRNYVKTNYPDARILHVPDKQSHAQDFCCFLFSAVRSFYSSGIHSETATRVFDASGQ